MSNIDYSALINDEQTSPKIESAAPIAATKSTERWYSRGQITGHIDDNYSIIDKYKVIQINDKQINVTQENRGQYVPFEMARYYDGIDLAQGSISINYVRNGETNSQREPAVNIQYTNSNIETDRLRFGWLLSEAATSIAGPLQFEIWVEGQNGPDGIAYLWKSQPLLKGFEVLKGLGDGEIIEINDDWRQEIVNLFAETIAESNLANYTTKTEVNSLLANKTEELKDYTDSNNIVSLNFTKDDNYIVTLTLTRGDGTTVVNSIDLPLESVVVDGSYNPVTKIITLTLQNGNTIDIEVADLISGLASEEYVTQTITEALADYVKTQDVPTKVSDLENDANYTTLGQVTEMIADADISSKLEEYATTEYVDGRFGNLGQVEIEGGTRPKTVEEYVSESVASVDVTDQLQNYITTEKFESKLGTFDEGITVKEYIDNIDVTEQLSNYYTKQEIDTKLDSINVDVDLTNYYNKQETAVLLADELSGYATKAYVDAQTGGAATEQLTYDISYDPTVEEGANFIFYEIEKEGQSGEVRTAKQSYRISGGGGTGGGAIKVYYVTNSPVVSVIGDRVNIQYKFEGTDSAGEAIGSATATWKIGSRILATEEILSLDANGELKVNSFDVTNYLNVGTQKISLTVVDDSGNQTTKNWQVQVIDIRIESSFDDTIKQTANTPVSFNYKPFGTVDKLVHIIFDGKETVVNYDSSVSNVTKSIELPGKSHGTYLLEAYITASVNGNDIRSESLFRDIIYYNPEATRPVIGSRDQNFTVKQYNTYTTTITVYDPSTSAPEVDIYHIFNGVEKFIKTEKLLEKNSFQYDFREAVAGNYKIKLVCGDTEKQLNATVEELGINISPVTAGLVFDFNPSGRVNDENGKNWSDRGITMTVTDNFDWINGGYHPDENGDQYFKVKAGTRAIINYKLFANDAKQVGKEFKVIFKTENIRTRNTSILSCLNGGIGLDMRVEEANIYSNENKLYAPYCENEIIEFEFNINKCKFADDGTITEGQPIVLTYEDGVANRPMVYTSSSSFWQKETQNIVIGSDDCDVLIYRMKAYDNELQDNEILSNFIADARNANEMIDRYNRNQIYDAGGKLTPETLAKACPNLRIIMVEAPWFTNDKNNKVENTTITMRYENGDRYLDNWTCVNARHSGQGTSSNDYGYAGRNIDLIMNDENSLFTFGDNTTGKKITLTRESVPTDYLNVKVNIASSENQNNAQFAERYNRFDPYVREAKLKDAKVKDTMEFYNCVLFIKESNPDITTHREFNDTDWHFYAIGNVGDSKKTDKTRVNNSSDPKECVIEIMDFDKPLSEFPTGKEGNAICPEAEWISGNTAYDNLYSGYGYKDGEFKNFGAGSYEFRYEMKGITEEQREENINAWREFYKFVVTSDDDKFRNDFSKYFVLDSALYFYLFTERYTMVDNRAKNSFWHYGKTYYTTEQAAGIPGLDAKYINNEQAAFNNGYRWDLTFGYDFDTSLGIDNTGKLILTYGKEDIDQYSTDGSDTSMIYRAAKSVFFCRTRDLFKPEMQTMFRDRENAGAWDSNGLITQWDNAQKEFPEELWRLDIQRKYIRTFTGASIDNSKVGSPTQRFLAEMLNGRKKYQRRMFERNQEIYMATKYFGTTATNDKITLRFNNPETYVIKPDFTLRLTPYSDMYIGVQYGNNIPADPIRAKAGQEYLITRQGTSTTADITNIFAASFIQAIGDLSAGYVGDNDFSKASRLQSLSIGNTVPRLKGDLSGQVTSSAVEGGYRYLFTPISTGISTIYQNIKIKELQSDNNELSVDDFKLIEQDKVHYIVLTKETGTVAINTTYTFTVEYDAYFNNYMKKLSLGNNTLLNYLDIRNVSGLESAIDLSRCGNLAILDAEGAGATGVAFANGGRLQSAKLPKIKTLTAKNLNELITFEVAGYDNLQSLVIEGCPVINSYNILSNAPNLEILRLIDINWPESYGINNGTHLDRALNMRGVNASGAEIERSIITGNAFVKNMRQAQLRNYSDVWSLLNIDYSYLIKQYSAYFMNEGVIVDTQLIDEGGLAVDPITRAENPIPVPTKESTIAEKYTFLKWTPENFDPMYADKYYVAAYTTSPMQYTINYTGLGVQPYSATVNYGEVVEYPYGTPTYTEAANMYYWFKGWDKSGYANGNKTITAKYDTCSYAENYFKNKPLNTLTPVEMYMLTQTAGKYFQLKTGTDYLNQKEFILRFGNDFDYETTDIQSEVITENYELLGEQRLDTNKLLLDGKKDFVLAVDFVRGDNGNATIFQCHNTESSAGFRVNCTEKETTFVWNEKAVILESNGNFNREMIVIRHNAGDKFVHLYYSQKDQEEILYNKIEALQEPTDALSLVFGCRKNGQDTYSNYAKGTIYWSKLWYGDLGDAACRELAAWPHETMAFETCSIMQESVNYGSGILTLIAKNLLPKPQKILNTSSVHTGGWPTYKLGKYLNDRIYNSMNIQYKNLIKLANVPTTYYGDSGAQIAVRNESTRLFIPSLIEMGLANSQSNNIYQEEGEGTFDNFAMADYLICSTPGDNGVPYKYWLRSLVEWYKYGFYVVDTDGNSSPVSGTDTNTYVRFMFTI